jgi:hypothetical protein
LRQPLPAVDADSARLVEITRSFELNLRRKDAAAERDKTDDHHCQKEIEEYDERMPHDPRARRGRRHGFRLERL